MSDDGRNEHRDNAHEDHGPYRRALQPGTTVRYDRYTGLDEKLAEVVAASPTPPSWKEAWAHSTRGRNDFIRPGHDEATPEERLAVWQAVRDSGDLPPDTGLYLVAEQVEFLAEVRVEEVISEACASAAEAAAGQGLAEWADGKGVSFQELDNFRVNYPGDWDRVYVGLLISNGEKELARLYTGDREEFEARLGRGMSFFYPEPAPRDPPPAPPQWLRDFMGELSQAQCGALLDGSGPASVFFGYTPQDGAAEVFVCLAPGEFVEGPSDGQRIVRAFLLDIGRLTSVFDEAPEALWCPFGPDVDDDDGPPEGTLQVRGAYRGNRLVLTWSSRPPEGAKYDPLSSP